jgi:hypothetical protein
LIKTGPASAAVFATMSRGKLYLAISLVWLFSLAVIVLALFVPP